MHIYPGSSPISFAATASPGTVVSPQPAGTGLYSLPQVVDGNDPRSAANLMAAAEANRDCVNWITWRLPDFISGGDYRSLFKGATVSISDVLFIDLSAVNLAGATALIVEGDTAGGTAIQGQATSGNGVGVQGFGHGSGPGIGGQGGASGFGGNFLGGSGLGGGGASCSAGVGSHANGVQCFGDGTNWWGGVAAQSSFGCRAMNGVWVESGPFFRSGPLSASLFDSTREHLQVVVDADIAAIDPSIYDVVMLHNTVALTADRSWPLNAPASGQSCFVLIMLEPGSSWLASHVVNVKDGGSGNVLAGMGNPGTALARIYWSSTLSQWVLAA